MKSSKGSYPINRSIGFVHYWMIFWFVPKCSFRSDTNQTGRNGFIGVFWCGNINVTFLLAKRRVGLLLLQNYKAFRNKSLSETSLGFISGNVKFKLYLSFLLLFLNDFSIKLCSKIMFLSTSLQKTSRKKQTASEPFQ